MTTARTRVEFYAAIRRDARAGLSEREIQRQHHVGWRTVKAALSSAWPAERAAYPARTSKLDPFKPVIDQILVADLDAPQAAAYGHADLHPAHRRALRTVWGPLVHHAAEGWVEEFLIAGLQDGRPRPVSPRARARAIKRLAERGLTADEIRAVLRHR